MSRKRDYFNRKQNHFYYRSKYDIIYLDFIGTIRLFCVVKKAEILTLWKGGTKYANIIEKTKRRDYTVSQCGLHPRILFYSEIYFIPKSILDRCGSELNSIPRNPRKLLQNRNAIAMVESDLFLLAIIDAYAYMVWPFMGLGAKREIYSGYEPSWIFSHAAPYWIQEIQEKKILPAAKELLKGGGVDEAFGYVSEEEIPNLFSWLVPQTMTHHNMNAVIDTAKKFRCFEDFDYWNSRQKIDHYRKWYHIRVKNITVESLDKLKERYAENNDGIDWDVPDEHSDTNRIVLEPMTVSEFLASLSETDRQILTMRIEGITLERIAEKLGFKTHSAVHKRIRKVGLAYEKFSGEDFGFSQKKII